jgi:hypothetical protein
VQFSRLVIYSCHWYSPHLTSTRHTFDNESGSRPISACMKMS